MAKRLYNWCDLNLNTSFVPLCCVNLGELHKLYKAQLSQGPVGMMTVDTHPLARQIMNLALTNIGICKFYFLKCVIRTLKESCMHVAMDQSIIK